MIRRLPLLLLTAALAGCSLVINVGYSLVDNALVWYVRDYFPLNVRQEAVLKSGLAEVRRWHCSTQLPQYAQWLRGVSAELQRGMSRDDVARRAAEVQAHWRVLLAQLAPVLARTFESATPEQVVQLAANFDASNREYRNDWVDVPREALAAKRAERATTQLTRWIGGLHSTQAETVARWSRAFDPTGGEWLAFRERWQAAFLATLAEATRPAHFDVEVARLFVDYDALWSPELRRKVAANRGATLEMIYDVQRLMTDAQRRQVAEVAESYAAEFDRMACAPSGGAIAAPR